MASSLRVNTWRWFSTMLTNSAQLTTALNAAEALGLETFSVSHDASGILAVWRVMVTTSNRATIEAYEASRGVKA